MFNKTLTEYVASTCDVCPNTYNVSKASF